ncbi:hypothetical protein V6N13_123844 [Hibiscus sabdariffa]|uniref:Uncharacterized protein n=1 Tax=Hibiscus sabdariffa TaxID=183260 RepID=A0ABR2QV38_9ROSI
MENSYKLAILIVVLLAFGTGNKIMGKQVLGRICVIGMCFQIAQIIYARVNAYANSHQMEMDCVRALPIVFAIILALRHKNQLESDPE